MGDIEEKKIFFPLDGEGFLRRECPLCYMEFKIWIPKEDLIDLALQGIDSFLLQSCKKTSEAEEQENADKKEYFCPYCGQKALSDHWWTQEQLAYIRVIAKNKLATMINEDFLKPLKKSFGNNSLIKVKTNELRQKEEWISPERDDMAIFDLPCCQKKIKVEEATHRGVYCYFCGFKHPVQSQ